MTQPISSLLKLHQPVACQANRSQPDLADLTNLCQAFTQATGWPLRYVAGPQPDQEFDLVWSAPVAPGVGNTPGHLRIDLGGAGLTEGTQADLDDTTELADSLAELWSDLQRTRAALRQREAELAAGVPVVALPDEARRLAVRLEATIRSGATAIGCDAAALYLLDDATSELKLRASWGLPSESLLQPARPLRGALADLEALLGHAVALEDINPQDPWNSPEDFAAAVCVPVSSAATLLGTFWLFSSQPRPFSGAQTNLAEIVAGRLAADLEREVLICEGVAAAALVRESSLAEQQQVDQYPSIAPPVEGWDVSGWSQQAGKVGGAFHDWFVLDDGCLALAVGHADQIGLAGGMSAAALRAALRAHAKYVVAPRAVLTGMNQTLWSASAGDQPGTLLYAIIDPRNGQVRYALAGSPHGLLFSATRYESLTQPATALGDQPDLILPERRRVVLPGESLVFYGGNGAPFDGVQSPFADGDLGKQLIAEPQSSAASLAAMVREFLSVPGCGDLSAVVIRRNWSA